jgi:hypothetical protein
MSWVARREFKAEDLQLESTLSVKAIPYLKLKNKKVSREKISF